MDRIPIPRPFSPYPGQYISLSYPDSLQECNLYLTERCSFSCMSGVWQTPLVLWLIDEYLRIILYFSILLHCIVQWVLWVMSPSPCCYIVCWVFHCWSLFTTSFSLLGHLQVCTCLLIFKESASLLFGYVLVEL
jgi:hypothetical protein